MYDLPQTFMCCCCCCCTQIHSVAGKKKDQKSGQTKKKNTKTKKLSSRRSKTSLLQGSATDLTERVLLSMEKHREVCKKNKQQSGLYYRIIVDYGMIMRCVIIGYSLVLFSSTVLSLIDTCAVVLLLALLKFRVEDFLFLVQVFFVIRLQSKQPDAELNDIKDPDPLMNIELLDGRDPFLTMAREKHLEFSSLRRAKFSTSVLLYELHLQAKDSFIYMCNSCRANVETRYHCSVCEVGSLFLVSDSDAIISFGNLETD